MLFSYAHVNGLCTGWIIFNVTGAQIASLSEHCMLAICKRVAFDLCNPLSIISTVKEDWNKEKNEDFWKGLGTQGKQGQIDQ